MLGKLITSIILHQIVLFFFTSPHSHLIFTSPSSANFSVHPFSRSQHLEFQKFTSTHYSNSRNSRLQWKVPWQTKHRGLIFTSLEINTSLEQEIFSANFLSSLTKTQHRKHIIKFNHKKILHSPTTKMQMTSNTSYIYMASNTGHLTRAGNNSANIILGQQNSEQTQARSTHYGAPTTTQINDNGSQNKQMTSNTSSIHMASNTGHHARAGNNSANIILGQQNSDQPQARSTHYGAPTTTQDDNCQLTTDALLSANQSEECAMDNDSLPRLQFDERIITTVHDHYTTSYLVSIGKLEQEAKIQVRYHQDYSFIDELTTLQHATTSNDNVTHLRDPLAQPKKVAFGTTSLDLTTKALQNYKTTQPASDKEARLAESMMKHDGMVITNNWRIRELADTADNLVQERNQLKAIIEDNSDKMATLRPYIKKVHNSLTQEAILLGIKLIDISDTLDF